MTENEKKVSERDRRRRRKYRLTISILMVLLLATLFIVQCQLSNLKSEMLAEREAMLDSITAYDNHRLDSLQRYTDSLEAARADSIQRYNDSLANAQPKKELSPKKKPVSIASPNVGRKSATALPAKRKPWKTA